MPLLTVSGLCKTFGQRTFSTTKALRQESPTKNIAQSSGGVVAVSNVSFHVEEGEILVIMGSSGCGKSTMIRCLNRLIEPSSGSVLIGGDDVTKASPAKLLEIRRHRIAMVFQSFALLPHRSVVDNVALGLKFGGIGAKQRQDRARTALAKVGLEKWADFYPDSLSGGMKQRVGIARALVTSADLLLMDEAFSALDAVVRKEMQDELLALQRDMKRSVIFVTHDMHEALRVGDRIIVMKEGRVVQCASGPELVSRPADDYIAGFVKDVDRSRILTVGHAVKNATGQSAAATNSDRTEHSVDSKTKLADVFGRFSASPVLSVINDDRAVIGTITAEDVMRVLSSGNGRDA